MTSHKEKKRKREQYYKTRMAKIKKEFLCVNCGQPGAHYVPPGFGMPGFFDCEKEKKNEN
jgi:hypothetical protein